MGERWIDQAIEHFAKLELRPIISQETAYDMLDLLIACEAFLNLSDLTVLLARIKKELGQT